MLISKIFKIVLTGLGILLILLISIYPFTEYLFNWSKHGFLNSKSDAVFNNLIWRIGFITHILFGGISLLIGWTLFIKKWRNNYLRLHRISGKIYVICVVFSAIGVFLINKDAEGGIIAKLGFFVGNIFWIYFTLKAFTLIRQKKIIPHQKMMIFSYSVCLAAVSLRIILPTLAYLLNDFIIAYQITAWISWIVNIIIGYFIANKIQMKFK